MVSPNFQGFARNLENRLNTCSSNPIFRLVSMSEVEFFYHDSKLQHCGPCKFFLNLLKTFAVVTLKMMSCKIMSQKKVKKSEKPIFYGQNKLLSQHHGLQNSGSFTHMVTCRCSPRTSNGKMNLNLILRKTSPRACTELEFDVFGIPEKLVKYVVHLSKRKH